MANRFYRHQRVIVDSPRPFHSHVRGVDGMVINERGPRAKNRPGQVKVLLNGLWGRGWFHADELSPLAE